MAHADETGRGTTSGAGARRVVATGVDGEALGWAVVEVDGVADVEDVATHLLATMRRALEVARRSDEIATLATVGVTRVGAPTTRAWVLRARIVQRDRRSVEVEAEARTAGVLVAEAHATFRVTLVG